MIKKLQALRILVGASLILAIINCGGSGDEETAPCLLSGIGIESNSESAPIAVSLFERLELIPEENTVYTVSCQVPKDLIEKESKSFARVLTGIHLFTTAEEIEAGDSITLFWDFRPADSQLIADIEKAQTEETEFQTVSEFVTITLNGSVVQPDLGKNRLPLRKQEVLPNRSDSERLDEEREELLGDFDGDGDLDLDDMKIFRDLYLETGEVYHPTEPSLPERDSTHEDSVELRPEEDAATYVIALPYRM